jgi:hypothetical protein
MRSTTPSFAVFVALTRRILTALAVRSPTDRLSPRRDRARRPERGQRRLKIVTTQFIRMTMRFVAATTVLLATGAPTPAALA